MSDDQERNLAAHSPRLSAAAIAALDRIAETLKPLVDLRARFRPNPSPSQSPPGDQE